MLIGCDFHIRFEQIAMPEPTRREIVEPRWEDREGEAVVFCAGLPEPVWAAIERTIHVRAIGAREGLRTRPSAATTG